MNPLLFFRLVILVLITLPPLHVSEGVHSADFTPAEEQQIRKMLDNGWTLCGTAEFHAKLDRMLNRGKLPPIGRREPNRPGAKK